MANNTTTENWNRISQLLSLSETNEIENEKELETIPSEDNWDAISNLFGISVTTEAEKVFFSPTVLLQGLFVVKAEDEQGYLFENPLDRTVQITFFANETEKWTIDKNDEITYPPVEGITGLTDKTNQDAKAKDLPLGSLIVQQDNLYQMVGWHKTLVLQPQEIIVFYCNDNYFSDNEGSMSVGWFVETYENILTRDQFQVDAAQQYSFANPFKCDVQLYFVPKGEWQTHSNANPIPHTGDSTKPMTEAGDGYLAEQVPVGCLLVKVNNTWEAVGESKSLTLQANASLDFACNVKPTNYPEGKVTIGWVLERVL